MKNVIVVGGGMSGMMAALHAAKYHNVTLLERNNSCGKKLLITGNKRCNILNNRSTSQFIKKIHNGKFLYSTFSQIDLEYIKTFFKDHNLELIEEEDHRMYPITQRSTDVLNVLLKALEAANVKIMYNSFVSDIKLNSNRIEGVIVNHKVLSCDHLILATGGCSFPKLGSDGTTHHILKNKGIKISELYPVEAPLFSHDKFIKSLEWVGLSFLNVEVKVIDDKHKVIASVRDDLLITHKGLSGPAALTCAEYVYKVLKDHKSCTLIVNFLPSLKQQELHHILKQDLNQTLFNVLKNYLPKRFVVLALNTIEFDHKSKLSTLSNAKLEKLFNFLYRHTILIHDVTDLKYAFVTGGGVDLSEIDSSTYKHKQISNLSICGELLDLHGPIGGYNLSLAALSGIRAGQEV